MHFGQGEPIVKYTMNEINLEGTKEEKDLGVLISDNIQPSIQKDLGVLISDNIQP